MAFSKSLTVLAAVAVAAAKGLTVLHTRTSVPSGFVNHGPAPVNDQLTLRFGLAHTDAAGLQTKLQEVSTPGNANFRQWLSMEEIKTYMEPSAETVAAFQAFASANGLNTSSISPNGDWFSITLPVSRANELFDANFELFSHAKLDTQIARTMSVSLPAEIVGIVDVIHPSTSFAEPRIRLAPSPIELSGVPADKRAVASSCDTTVPSGIITPTCLQEIYGIPATRATSKNNSLLVTGYSFEYARKADLKAFLKTNRPDISSSTTFAVQNTAGGTNPQGVNDAGGEADLDIEYTVGVATGVPTTFLSVGELDFYTALLDTTTYVDGLSSPPTVMTTSYGLDETGTDPSVANSICNAFMALGARGISVVFASGDGGVRGGHDDSTVCKQNTFIPVFPAACPYLTSVGATQGFPEKAINFTSGGFSDIFPAPSYQTAQIASFIKTIPSNFKGKFNRTGRGFPDVAVQGWNFEVVIGDVPQLTGGTSAAAPTFASIIALINDKLLAAGKPVLGFLNPFLYANPGAFNDITKGHNSGFVCPASSVAFDAAAGWDPLTGLGTPNFTRLLAAAMA
ncbi:unnamed protein product [Mycena citricolor]|uniref:tripeptidyl-peptidase II n=1 Tax=Mycena citricolor TaxID=2018698 RepID=A0AAD2K636_9AGAR|nr:unnamed protein product [Mycena citricolor]